MAFTHDRLFSLNYLEDLGQQVVVFGWRVGEDEHRGPGATAGAVVRGAAADGVPPEDIVVVPGPDQLQGVQQARQRLLRTVSAVVHNDFLQEFLEFSGVVGDGGVLYPYRKPNIWMNLCLSVLTSIFAENRFAGIVYWRLCWIRVLQGLWRHVGGNCVWTNVEVTTVSFELSGTVRNASSIFLNYFSRPALLWGGILIPWGEFFGYE